MIEEIEVKGSPDDALAANHPGAVRFIRLTGERAQRLSHLHLHREDFQHALECVKAVVPFVGQIETHLARALWTSAIVSFTKCFGGSASRERLEAKVVFANDPDPAMALESFNYFKAVRDKHIAHDENLYSQSFPGAVVNGPDNPRSVDKIVCLTGRAQQIESQSHTNLRLLLGTAVAWVETEISRCTKELLQELQATPYEELLTRDLMPGYTLPVFGDEARTRPRV